MKKIIIGIVAVFIIVALFVGFNKKDSAKIKIGVLAPLTGVVADYGEEIKKGILAAASSTDMTGVEFVFEDDKCEPKEAVSAFNKLVSVDKATVILGPACGSPQEAVVPLIKDNSAVVLVMSAASKGLYEKSEGNFFNIQYSLEGESTFNALKMNEMGYKKVALVTYRNAFSNTHAEAFKAAYKGQIFDHVLTDNSTDVSPEIAKIKAEKPDAIYVPDIAFFFAGGLSKLKQYGVAAPVYSTYVAELPAVRALVPGVTYSFPADLSGTQGAVYELSKQAAVIALDAVKECKNSASCVKDHLNKSGKFSQYGVYQRTVILKQIKDGKAVDLQQQEGDQSGWWNKAH